jgi:hypothetical protein
MESWEDDEFKKGASASLNRTLTELFDYVDEPGPRNRGDLRQSVNELIADLVVGWIRYGFYLGHKEAYREFRDSGEFPPTITYTETNWEITPGTKRDLPLDSRIRRT